MLLELRRTAFYDPRGVCDGGTLKRPQDLDDDTAAAIRELEVVTRAATYLTRIDVAFVVLN